jgi:hypothetical protein
MLRVGASYDSDEATRMPQFATRSEVCIRAPSARVPSAIAAEGIGRGSRRRGGWRLGYAPVDVLDVSVRSASARLVRQDESDTT